MLELPEEIRNKLLNYLKVKPYQEVVQIINDFATLKKAKAKKVKTKETECATTTKNVPKDSTK